MRALALIDGEHYPPVVRDALAALPYEFACCVNVGGGEKLRLDSEPEGGAYGVPLAGSIELLVLGLVTEVCIGGAVGRIGHAADGGVMGATVVAMMGGSAVVAAGGIAVLDRE